MRVRGIGLGVLVSMGACAGGDSSSSAFSVTDSAGVRMVRVDRPDWSAARVDEVLRIGVIDGEDPYQFNGVGAMAVAADGTLYVGNGGSASVRVFDTSGTFVREFGRRGRGPGELTGIQHVGMLGDTAVAVAATSTGQGLVFSRSGDLLYTPLPPDSAGIFFLFGSGPDGWLALGQKFNLPGVHTAPLREGDAWTMFAYLRDVGPAGLGSREFAVPVYEAIWDAVRGEAGLIPFGPVPAFGMDGSGTVIVSRSATYRIERYREGRLTDVIMRTHEPVPLDDGLLADLLEGVDRRGPAPWGDYRERDKRSLEYRWQYRPQALPPLHRIVVASDGGFWIERRDHLDPLLWQEHRMRRTLPAGVPSRWDVYGPEGRLRAEVELPGRFAPMALRGDEVAGVLHDELDVEYVVVYRISEADDGGREP